MKKNNTQLWVIAIIGIVLLLAFFGISGFGGYGMMGMMGGGYGYGMMFFGWITWVLVAILIIAGIYWLIKTANRK